MRKIRFRAWDIENKCMRNNVAVGLGMVEYDLSCHQPVEIMIPMQFTGLFDKNGTPIYEGDIVKCKFAFGDNVCEVVEEKGCYWVSQKNKEIKDKAHDNLYWHIDGIEVLGNIYEHPHLLESEGK
jgi:uncharacterized phage protein (TIGR01671 family)